MKSVDLAIAIISIKDLQIKTLQDRIAMLESIIESLRRENNELRAENDDLQHDMQVELKRQPNHTMGFKAGKP
jgi:FtsZ-binding cell division protein ZapB